MAVDARSFRRPGSDGGVCLAPCRGVVALGVGIAGAVALLACAGDSAGRSPWIVPEYPVVASAAPAPAAHRPGQGSSAGEEAWPASSAGGTTEHSVPPESDPAAPGRGDAGAAGLWWTDDQAAFAEARRARRPVVIDFWASWCPPCNILDSRTFADEQLRAELTTFFVPVRLDVTEQTEANRQRLRHYRVYSLPAILVFGPEGREMDRISAYIRADGLLERLRAVRDRLAPPRRSRPAGEAEVDSGP